MKKDESPASLVTEMFGKWDGELLSGFMIG